MGNIQKKDGFIFYKSFYDSINALDESMQLEVYKALAEYGLTGEMRRWSITNSKGTFNGYDSYNW